MTTHHEKKVVFGLLLITMLCMGVIDLYVPSLPTIALSLQANPSLIQLSFPAYLIPFALVSLIAGPLSDFFGRRIFLLTGLTTGIVGACLCYNTQTALGFIIGRVLQGLGFGIDVVLARAILRDIASGHKMIRYSSFITAIGAVVVGIAPIAGGLIETAFNWRIGFVVIATAAIVTGLYCLCYVPETNHHQQHNQQKSWRAILGDYKTPLSSPSFWGYTLCAGIAQSGLICYAFTVPFILTEQFALSPVYYGLYALLIALSYMATSFCNPSIVKQIGSRQTIMLGFGVMLLGGLGLFIVTALGLNNVWQLILPCLVFIIGTSFIYPNINAAILTPFEKTAGIVAALSSSLQLTWSFFIPAVVALMPHERNTQILAYVFCTLPILSFIAFVTLVSKQPLQSCRAD